MGKIGKLWRAAGVLAKALKNENAGVSTQATDALIKLKSESVVDELVAIVNDHSQMWPRYDAVRILGETGGKKAADALLEAMRNDDDNQVRIYAADALEKIG